jgi:hypothetical protein
LRDAFFLTLDRKPAVEIIQHQVRKKSGPIARLSPPTSSAADKGNPVRVVAFNTAEGSSRDVSEEIADELAQCPGARAGRDARRSLRTSSIRMAARVIGRIVADPSLA